MVKISDYTTITSLADEDLLDISQWDSVGLDFNTKSITWEDIKKTLYSADTKDANSDPAVNSRTFFYTASAPGGTMYLPGAATAVAGAIVSFIRIADAGVAANIASSGCNVNGVGLYAASTILYDVQTFYFDGANWYGG